MIASFDIGKRNFAFCIEKVSPEFKPDILEYDKDGTLRNTCRKSLDALYKSGEIVLFKLLDITNGVNMTHSEMLISLTNILDSFTESWEKCDTFVVEMQMNFGKAKNPTAMRIAYHTMSYFLINYPEKIIVEYGAFNKTRILGARKKMTKPERKKWAVLECQYILSLRQDETTIEIFNSMKKKDDIADTIVQLQAYKYTRCK